MFSPCTITMAYDAKVSVQISYIITQSEYKKENERPTALMEQKSSFESYVTFLFVVVDETNLEQNRKR